jgi:hypothetical protein
MNNATYLVIQADLADMARRLRRLDLDRFIARAERAEVLGPIVDPTLYRAAEACLADVIRLAQAAKTLQDVAKELDEGWLARIANAAV